MITNLNRSPRRVSAFLSIIGTHKITAERNFFAPFFTLRTEKMVLNGRIHDKITPLASWKFAVRRDSDAVAVQLYINVIRRY